MCADAGREPVEIFDTTLRDGSQREGFSLTVDDKLRIARQLDRLGVTFVEGGWPGANPKDTEFFARARAELSMERAVLVAFGSTRRAGRRAEDDAVLADLLAAGTPAVCLVAKASAFHVVDTLRTDLDEAIAMVTDSVAHLVAHGRRVLVDAEHFFDGYGEDPAFSSRVVDAALDAGAETVVLCDTNGGTLPHDAATIVAALVEQFGGQRIGVHFHDDGGCAVANSLAAVRAGARHVQGCINGYGERTGNANLTTIIPDLSLKMGFAIVPSDRLALLTEVSHHVAEVANLPLDPQQPYVGTSAFAHKAGLHASALARRPGAYEHVDPAAVGNGSRFVVSEMAGRSTIDAKAAELGIALSPAQAASVLTELKELEHRGFHFEVADGSLELLLRRASGWVASAFELESYRVIVEATGSGRASSEATVRLRVDGVRSVSTGEGNGPVHALDAALRAALLPHHPRLGDVRLVDYKVRVLDTPSATGATTRVLIDTTDGESSWTTIGVSTDIIQASWQALVDSVVIGLLRTES